MAVSISLYPKHYTKHFTDMVRGRLKVGKVWGSFRLSGDGPNHQHLTGNHPCLSLLIDFWGGIFWVCLLYGLV